MKIGTRRSRLAVIQTELVAEAVRSHFPEINIEIEGYETKGDIQMHRSLSDFGGKGAFTKEIEQAILEGAVDMAVHSAKDMPLDMQEGLAIAAVLRREDSRDVWISCRPESMAACGQGTVAGTGSKRRELQAMELNPGLEVRDIRGNVPTRLRKLADGMYDGIILAAAGLRRLGYLSAADEVQSAHMQGQMSGSFVLEGRRFYYEYLPEGRFLPAAGQGIIAIETRQDDCGEIMAAVNDRDTWLMLLAERAFLRGIGGGCNEAAAILTRIQCGHLIIQARYAGKEERMQTVFVRKALAESQEVNERLAEASGLLAAERLMAMEEDGE